MNTMRLRAATLMLLVIAGTAGCGTQSIVTTNPPVNAASSNPRVTSLPHHQTFTYTGKVQSFVVPAHVTSLNVDVRGAAGGGTSFESREYFGRGGRIRALIPVHPREELYVYVGGKGSTSVGGFNGGGNSGPGRGSDGGGGASDLRTRLSMSARIVVGAGGGGEGSHKTLTGGKGGGKVGGDGGGCSCGDDGGGGFGGTQKAGGAGGAPGSGSAPGQQGAAGTLGSGGIGGAGGSCNSSTSCGCDYNRGCPGAGGGGGYYGGGGGGGGGSGYYTRYGSGGGGGGGGSSWAEARAVNVKTWSGWYKATGNGLVVLNWR